MKEAREATKVEVGEPTSGHEIAVVFDRLRRSPWQIAVAITGGGSGIIPMCFRRAGASSNFVEAVVPYSRSALEKYLGCPPVRGSASIETALQAADTAFARATELCADKNHAVGIALLAVLPTCPPRNEAIRICVAIRSSRLNEKWFRELNPRDHDREAAEVIAESMFISAIVHLLDH